MKWSETKFFFVCQYIWRQAKRRPFFNLRDSGVSFSAEFPVFLNNNVGSTPWLLYMAALTMSIICIKLLTDSAVEKRIRGLSPIKPSETDKIWHFCRLVDGFIRDNPCIRTKQLLLHDKILQWPLLHLTFDLCDPTLLLIDMLPMTSNKDSSTTEVFYIVHCTNHDRVSLFYHWIS